MVMTRLGELAVQSLSRVGVLGSKLASRSVTTVRMFMPYFADSAIVVTMTGNFNQTEGSRSWM